MLAEIPASVWYEWLAFNKIDPISDRRADLRAGIIASTVAEVNRDRKRRSRPYEAKDFMPRFERAQPQSVEEMIEIAREITLAFGGQDLRGQRPH